MEGVIPPRGWRPRGFLTQKIMKKRRDWIINCFILIYFRKLNKIHQNVQRFSLNTFGETTSPLSRKSINCSSVIAFPLFGLYLVGFLQLINIWYFSRNSLEVIHMISYNLFTIFNNSNTFFLRPSGNRWTVVLNLRSCFPKN